MYRNTHASVGQNQGWMLSAPTRKTPGSPRLCRGLSGLPRGISLTEVLIAMGILTVGLLGVAAIFPVGSYYMQKGDVSDRGSAIAQAAFSDALARGMFEPRNWLMFETATIPANKRWTYSKPFASKLRDALSDPTLLGVSALQRNRTLNTRFGTVYVIDPLGANGASVNPSILTDRKQVSTAQRFPMDAVLGNYTHSLWWPWNPIGTNQNEARWPVVRVSLEQPAGDFTPWPMTQPVSERLFMSSDDLAIEMPAQSDRPSAQRLETFDVDNDGDFDPLARQSRGDYSWIATIAPSSSDARNALALDPSAFSYEVSVAVYFKRVLDTPIDANKGERLTIAKVVSSGLNGGELLIETIAGDPATDPFAGLKVGRWVSVCGPSPNSTSENPRFVFHWYRVLSIDKESNGINPATQRLVTLRGAQWPWQPAANLTAADLSNNLCLAITPNVVAVHSKTMRLGGKSAWSIQ